MVCDQLDTDLSHLAHLSRPAQIAHSPVELVEKPVGRNGPVGSGKLNRRDRMVPQSRVRAARLIAPITAFCAAVVIDSCMPTPQITRVSSPCPISVST